jgi:hypothetical protein
MCGLRDFLKSQVTRFSCLLKLLTDGFHHYSNETSPASPAGWSGDVFGLLSFSNQASAGTDGSPAVALSSGFFSSTLTAGSSMGRLGSASPSR